MQDLVRIGYFPSPAREQHHCTFLQRLLLMQVLDLYYWKVLKNLASATIDFEQVHFSQYETNYLPALPSKAWSKRTFTVHKVQGAILNVFLICSSLESEDALNNVSLDCFWHIIHLFLSCIRISLSD